MTALVPNFVRSFIKETDANVKGLVQSFLSSRGMVRYTLLLLLVKLYKQEKNYPTTDLETLAVVWTKSHLTPSCMGMMFRLVLTTTLVGLL